MNGLNLPVRDDDSQEFKTFSIKIKYISTSLLPALQVNILLFIATKFVLVFLNISYTFIMIDNLYELPFHVLVPPNIKVRRPAFIKKPSNMTMFVLVLLSYFLVTGGIIYDIIIEPPSVGAAVDENGHSKPVAFMPYRVNGQYIMEGLASAFLFTIGGLGFIIMDHTHSSTGKTNLNRLLLIAMGFIFIIVSFFTTWLFMRMKLPSYLLN